MKASKITFALAVALAGAASLTALAQTPTPPQRDPAAERMDVKGRDKAFRVKVVSAGLPTQGGAEALSVRSAYRVYDKAGRLLGTGLIGDFVSFDTAAVPVELTIEVNGGTMKTTFDWTAETDADRAKASRDRGRPVELRPKGKAERLAIPTIWVVRPLAVKALTGYTIEPNPKEGEAPGSTGAGIAANYLPEDVRDRDDGVLYSNTLVHLIPGRYTLKVNKTAMDLELAAGESKLVRLGALSLGNEGPRDVVQSQGDAATPVGAGMPKLVWFAVAPGKYGAMKGDQFEQLCEVPPGGTQPLFQVERVYGDKPRLGVKADDAPGRGGALVLGFVDGTPAASSGLKVNDRIVAIDGSTIKDTEDMVKALNGKKPGDTIEMSVVREKGDPFPVKVKLAGQ